MDALAQQIARRDDQDRNRAESPLRPAEDAVVIDTTALNAEQVFQEIMRRMEG
jgi:cytidylate kinase